MHKVAYKNMSGSSSHGFDPYSAWCILSNAAKGKTSNRGLGRVGIPFEELIGSRSNLVELGKTLAQYNLPERSPEEIREELLSWRAKWNRVFELKKIESGVRALILRRYFFRQRHMKFMFW